MAMALVVLSGLCWAIVYVEAVRVGVRDRTYAIPIFALGLNLAWEALYAVHGLFMSPGAGAFVRMHTGINLVWVAFDVAILWTFFKFASNEWPQLGRSLIYLMGALALVVGVAVQIAFYAEFGPRDGGIYAAFAQNLLMSVLFLNMLVQRRGPRGQSMVIAFAKMVGTLAPTISLGFLSGFNPYVVVLGLLCLLFDSLYALGLWSVKDAHGVTASSPAGLRK